MSFDYFFCLIVIISIVIPPILIFRYVADRLRKRAMREEIRRRAADPLDVAIEMAIFHLLWNSTIMMFISVSAVLIPLIPIVAIPACIVLLIIQVISFPK